MSSNCNQVSPFTYDARSTHQVYKNDMYNLQRTVRLENFEEFKKMYKKCVINLNYEIHEDKDNPWIVDYSCDFDFAFATSLRYKNILITRFILDNYNNPLRGKIDIHYANELALHNAVRYRNQEGIDLLIKTSSIQGFKPFSHNDTINIFTGACMDDCVDIAKTMMTASLEENPSSVINPQKCFTQIMLILSNSAQEPPRHVVTWLIEFGSSQKPGFVDTSIENYFQMMRLEIDADKNDADIKETNLNSNFDK